MLGVATGTTTEVVTGAGAEVAWAGVLAGNVASTIVVADEE